jgi:multicomponent Na+:H+ antiporter subunit F
MGWAVVVCAVLIGAGAVLALVRLERGPSMLDRTVALDILVTALVAAVALYAALERRADVVPILVALSLVGFIGSVTIARFAAAEPDDARRLRTPQEVAALDEAARVAEEAELAARATRAVDRAAEVEEAAPERPGDDDEHGTAPEGVVR